MSQKLRDNVRTPREYFTVIVGNYFKGLKLKEEELRENYFISEFLATLPLSTCALKNTA